MRLLLLELAGAALLASATEFRDYSFNERLQFHNWLCSRQSSLRSCARPFTREMYFIEKHKIRQEFAEEYREVRAVRRSIDDEDEEFEYLLWKKHLRNKLRNRPIKIENHYYFNGPPRPRHRPYYPYYNQGYYQPNYYYPRYGGYGYPGYGGYGGGYGGYGGYGGGGNLFNIGFGRGLGIMTPIGGFGLGSFFNIGVG